MQVDPPSLRALWLSGAVLLWLCYVLVFAATGVAVMEAARAALCNVLPLALLAAATHALLRAQILERPVVVQILSHAGLAPAFALTWYSLVIVLLGFSRGVTTGMFEVENFSGPAFTWQVFQGLILYALVAAVCYAIRGGRRAAAVTIVDRQPPLDRYLIKDGDEMGPISTAEIVFIGGAQDYAEVRTLAGKHLVRMSLGEFEARLDPKRFIRVHRSTIINFDQLERAEPAGGGRMLAWMATGESVAVSRTGAQLLRSFVV